MHHDRDAVRTMLRRGTVVQTDDSGPQQLLTLKGLAGEQLKKVVRLQQFGLTSNMPVGAEGLIAALGGRSDRALFIGGEDQSSRVKNLPIGGVALYDASGQILKFVERNIEWVCGTLTITPTKVLIGATASVPVQLSNGQPSTLLFAE